MRALILIAGTSMLLSACGSDSVEQNGDNSSGAVAAEAIFANDTTVIDAATGDAADMAADVEYTVSNADGDGDISADGRVQRGSARRRQEPANEPAVEGSAGAAEPSTDENAL